MTPFKVKMYAIVQPEVKLPQFKQHLKNFRANRVSTLESDDINSVIFHVPVSQVSKAWTYLRKKRGIKKVWLGR